MYVLSCCTLILGNYNLVPVFATHEQELVQRIFARVFHSFTTCQVKANSSVHEKSPGFENHSEYIHKKNDGTADTVASDIKYWKFVKFIFVLDDLGKEDMLEKKTVVECKNSDTKAHDMNGGDESCHESHNGAISTAKSGGEDGLLTDLKIKTEEKSVDPNHCDDHLNRAEKSMNDDLGTSEIDRQTPGVPANNSCRNSCKTNSSNTQTAKPGDMNNGCGSGTSPKSSNTAAASVNPADVENVQDANFSQPPSENPSESSSAASNKENAPPVSGTNESEVPPMSAISNMVGSTCAAVTASVQPLPSNMVNKTSFPLETQYMQQQSQIFVFSTELANKAAESCLSGQYPSIIAFHCAQPGTKSFLEKYPLKVQQFNRQNPAVWLNTLASMKQGGRPVKGSMNQFHGIQPMNPRFVGPLGPQCGSPGIPCMTHNAGGCVGPVGQGHWTNMPSSNSSGPGVSDICGSANPQVWNHQSFGPGTNPRFPSPLSQGMNIRQRPPTNTMMSCNMAASVVGTPFQVPGSVPFNHGPGSSATLTGMKIPDENLTPEQRQHREEQLATIRKMQQMLFPEQQQQQQFEQMPGGVVAPPANVGLSPAGMLPQGSHNRSGSTGDICVHPNVDSCYSPQQACLNDHEHMHQSSHMFANQNSMSPGFHQNFPPASATAQLKWQELQHQFYEERRKKTMPSAQSLTYPVGMHAGPQNVPQHPQSTQHVLPHTPDLQSSQQQHSVNCPSPSVGIGTGARIQGPPPPYHQTNKKGISSPHPASPNPSSLSLPSPRMISGLASPADPSRHFPHPTPPGPRLPHPSPGTTPVGSSSLHTTPLNSPKPVNCSSGPNSSNSSLIKTPTTPSTISSTPAGTPTSSCVNTLSLSAPCTPVQCASNRKQTQCSDVQESCPLTPVNINADTSSVSCTVSTTSNTVQGASFCHTPHQANQLCSKQDQNSSQASVLCHREPSLMPVPSPQQIQYLNSFDGQELTIQKQPNTSMREVDIMSPSSVPSSMVMTSASHSRFQSPDTSSFPNTPGSCPPLENSQDSLSGRYPASAPASMEGNMQRFTAPSPQVPNYDTTDHHGMQALQGPDASVSQFTTSHGVETGRLPAVIAHSVIEEQNNIRFSSPSHQNSVYSPAQTGMPDNLTRFSGNSSDPMQRHQGVGLHTNNVGPVDMLHPRFGNPVVESEAHPVPFTNIGSESQAATPTNTMCLSGNFPPENMSHSHLHSLQKMTPPFDSITGNKVSSEVSSPMGLCSSNSSVNSSGNNNLQHYDNQIPPGDVSVPHRLTHFDPIASMAAMSESAGPLVTSVGGMHGPQNVNPSDIVVNCENSVNNVTNAMNFNPGMQPPRPYHPVTPGISSPNQCNQYMPTQVPFTLACASQTMNGSYINTPVPTQMPNLQNVMAPTTFGSDIQGSSMNSHAVVQHHHASGCQENSASTLSCSVTRNHPIMHSTVASKASNMCVTGPRPNHPYSGQPSVPRNAMPIGAATSPNVMAGAVNTSTSFVNSANVQVKAGAPNTIQYLPARPQNVSSVSSRQPSLEFLQRFAAPLTNLDNKVPTHNLQYFPNRVSNTPSGHGVTMAPAGPPSSGMVPSQRPMNMMMGPMLRGGNSIPHVGNQIFPVGQSLPSAAEPSVYGRMQCPGNSQLNSPMGPMNQIPGSQTAVFSGKPMPLTMSGITPDATQPLPPSMGQSFNYKQSTFYGPTTADPNYAVQFHNFQQQLYATNTRGNQMNSQNNISGQTFFGPK